MSTRVPDIKRGNILSRSPSPGRLTAIAKFLIVIVALSYAWTSQANLVSTAHDPASWSGHDNALLLAAQSGGNDHSHDDPPTGDQGAGHQHEYHATDHNHDKSNLPGSAAHIRLSLPEVWGAAPQLQAYSDPCFFFERPPKALPKA